MKLNLPDVAAALALIAAATAAVSYAFSVSYIFTLEPNFVQAFGVTDLVFLFVSSLSMFATLTIVLVPMLICIPIITAISEIRKTQKSQVNDKSKDFQSGENASAEAKSPYRSVEFIGVMILFSCILIGQTVAAFLSFLTPSEIIVSPAGGGFGVSGLLAMLGILIRPRLFIPLALPMALFVALSSAFMAGDVMARRDISSSNSSLPCAFTNGGKSCFEVLVLGSNSVILRRNNKVFLIPRTELKVIASRRIHVLKTQ